MRIAIIGAGLIGTRLALRCAAHGCAVTLIARDAVRARTTLAEASREASIASSAVTVSDELHDAAHAELVAETIVEDLGEKRVLYRQLEALVGAHVPFASGTSTLLPDTLGEGLHNPGRVIVAHMVHPVTVVPLVELVTPSAVDAVALATVERWLAQLTMRPIRLREPVAGFIVNRLQFALVREAASLVERGIVDAADVDAIVEGALGPRWAATGPLKSVELGGRRTFATIARGLVPTLDARDRIPLLEDETPLVTWDDDDGAPAARERRRRVYDAIEGARGG